MSYKLSDETWDENEYAAINRVVSSKFFTMGDEVKQFELEFAKKFNSKHGIMVNSGSSANLLAIAALVYSGRINKGDEVIVPAVSWSTTYFPLLQFGLKLVFVDINKDSLNIDLDMLNKAITKKTRFVFAVNLLGSPIEMNKLKSICKSHNIFFIEDNCESLGASFEGKFAGTFGVLGTYSTFYSHHISTMEGGIVLTDDQELYHYMLAIRAHGWTRNLPKDSSIYTKNEDPFYESFNFIVPGFNLRPLEMEAAVGREQIKKVDVIINNRINNAKYFVERIKNLDKFRIQKIVGESSWFGFAIIIAEESTLKRGQIIERLNEVDIEVRPIVSGNFVRNKVINYFDYSIYGELINADYVHDNGFFVGNHSSSNFSQVDELIEILKEF